MKVVELLKNLDKEGIRDTLSKVHYYYEENSDKEIRRECISQELSEVINYEKVSENIVNVYVKKLTVGDDIRRWRTNAGLTREEMSKLFDIPTKTIESWEVLSRVASPWVYRLIIDRLRAYTEYKYKEEAHAQISSSQEKEQAEPAIFVWAVYREGRRHIYVNLFEALSEYTGVEEIFYELYNGDTIFQQDEHKEPFIYMKQLSIAESDKMYKPYV